MRPCISSAPAITPPNVNPATRPASIHRSHYSPTICDPTRACPARCPSDLGEHSAMRRPLHLAVVQAGERQHLVGLSQRILGIQAKSRVPVRCPSRAAEHQCLRRVRRRRVFRSASVRQRRRKAGMRHPVFSIYCSPPGVGRANPRARPEHAVPVFARRWLRTPRFEYRMHGAIGVDAGGTHFAFMGEGRDCFGRTANSREEACVARWATRARRKERGFLVLSGR